MDFKKLTIRYKQFGGLRLVWQYAKLGVLPVVIKGVVKCVVKRQSFKAIYPEVLKRIEPMLIAKYGSRVQEFKTLNGSRSRIGELENSTLVHEHPMVIWWCWLQGKEQAPPIVQACFASLHRNLVQEVQSSNEGYEIKVIDAGNWKDYVELPDYISKKWEKKEIPAALFSDLLRLQLLIKYGGTWIDSTVLCTLDSSLKFQVSSAKKYLDADLFLFQYTPEGTTENIGISNWFISAHSNNEVLMTLRDMLFAYWKEYNCTLDYYIFHLFSAMVTKGYPDEIAAMPHGQSQNSLVLLHHWGEEFDQKKWDKLAEKVCFHKLAFRTSEFVKQNKDDYYNWIISNYIS